MVIATKDDYLRLLKDLLPPGPAWPRDDTSSAIAQVLDEIATECAIIDETACKLFEESLPGTASESYDDWLVDFGLPDDCMRAFLDANTVSQNLRRELVLKATRVGGQSIAFFKDVARRLGQEIEIVELHKDDDPSSFHKWRIDPPSVNDWNPGVRMRVSDTIAKSPAVSHITVIDATVQMTVDDALTITQGTLLYCLIQRLKPAHTEVFFNLGS